MSDLDYAYEDEDMEEFYDSLPCQMCEDGMVVACPDDLCRGAGGCMNLGQKPRTGCYRACPHCKGQG